MGGMGTRLTETVTLNEGLAADAVNEEAGVISDVALLGAVSKNRRRYTEAALNDAKRLYEGVAVHIDHKTRQRLGDDRGLLESVGVIRNTRITGGKVRGDFHYLKTDPISPRLVERARRMPETFGFSHDAEGETKEANGETLVESIERVNSLDLVLRPATNASLYESEDTTVSKPKKPRTVKQILESAPKGKLTDRLKALVEMEAVAADMPIDMPAAPEAEAADPAAEVQAALEKAAVAVLKKWFAGDIDEAAAIGEIKKIFGMAEEAGATEEEASPVAEPEVMESVRRELNELKAKTLLLESGREATPERVKAVSRCDSDKERKALVESWQKKDAPAEKPATARRPAYSPSRFTESEDADDDGYAGVLPGGKPVWERKGA